MPTLTYWLLFVIWLRQVSAAVRASRRLPVWALRVPLQKMPPLRAWHMPKVMKCVTQKNTLLKYASDFSVFQVTLRLQNGACWRHREVAISLIGSFKQLIEAKTMFSDLIMSASEQEWAKTPALFHYRPRFGKPCVWAHIEKFKENIYTSHNIIYLFRHRW